MNEQIKSNDTVLALTAQEAEQMIVENLPPIDHHGEKVEAVGSNSM